MSRIMRRSTTMLGPALTYAPSWRRLFFFFFCLLMRQREGMLRVEISAGLAARSNSPRRDNRDGGSVKPLPRTPLRDFNGRAADTIMRNVTIVQGEPGFCAVAAALRGSFYRLRRTVRSSKQLLGALCRADRDRKGWNFSCCSAVGFWGLDKILAVAPCEALSWF